MLLKDVIFAGADRSGNDLVVTAFSCQGYFRIPWREFIATYGKKATTAVEKRGWNLHNLDEASQSLLDHGTLESGQLEECQPRAKRARDSFMSGEPRSAFDWS